MKKRFVEKALVRVSGVGMAKASKLLTNDDLSKMVDTSDEWIVERTGIKSRYIVDEETVCDLAEDACRAAIKNSGLAPSDIGLIIVASITADSRMPSMACRLQARLGIEEAVAFDEVAACAGFLFAMNTAEALMALDYAEHALIVGAEAMSKYVDWTDRRTCVLFGDGAGAVVLSRNSAEETAGLKSLVWGNKGEDKADTDELMLGLSSADGARITMQGQAVYRFAVGVLPELINQALDVAGWDPADVDHVVSHQANYRILGAAAQKTGIALERWYMNLDSYGNTSAASVPIALAEMHEAGLLKSGDKLILLGFGGGLSYAANTVIWA